MRRSLPSHTHLKQKGCCKWWPLLIKVLMSQTSDTQILLVKSPFLFNQITALQSTHMPSPDPLIIKTKTMSRYSSYDATRILNMHNVHRKKLNPSGTSTKSWSTDLWVYIIYPNLISSNIHQMLIPTAFGVAFFWVTFRFVLAPTDATGITMKWLQPHTLCKISWTHYRNQLFAASVRRMPTKLCLQKKASTIIQITFCSKWLSIYALKRCNI